MKRRIFSVLIESGAFDYTVILGDASANGRIREILKTEDLSVENNCSCVDFRKHGNACFCDPILCK